jgi:hypothetical protein
VVLVGRQIDIGAQGCVATSLEHALVLRLRDGMADLVVRIMYSAVDLIVRIMFSIFNLAASSIRHTSGNKNEGRHEGINS